MAQKKARKRMGRPPGPPEQVRRNRIATTLTDGELARLDELAADRGVPLGTMLHELVRRALRRTHRYQRGPSK